MALLLLIVQKLTPHGINCKLHTSTKVRFLEVIVLRNVINRAVRRESIRNFWGSTRQERMGNSVLAGISCFGLFAGGALIAPAVKTLDTACANNITSPDNFETPSFP